MKNSYSGFTTVSPDGRDFYVSNLHSGVDQYLLPDLTLVRSFPQPLKENIPLQVATAFDGQLVIIGGDRGIVRVFNAATGNLVTALYHDEKGQFFRQAYRIAKTQCQLLEQARVQAVSVSFHYVRGSYF